MLEESDETDAETDDVSNSALLSSLDSLQNASSLLTSVVAATFVTSVIDVLSNALAVETFMVETEQLCSS